ncbi:MAG: hypothetical protein KJP10_04890, partial [Gammaproteobacteria bacterium]|nr:hypothetical protein [Gammaproteobacteria bacterium]
IIIDITLDDEVNYLLEEFGSLDSFCGNKGYVIPAGDNCNVWVTFRPQSGRADPFTAQVSIRSTDFDEPESIVRLTGTGGSDSDGVPDAEEENPVCGTLFDCNGDGTSDSQQASVASLHNHNRTFYATIEAKSNGVPVNLENVDTTAVSADLPDPNIETPYGFYSYSIIGLTDANATVRLILRQTPLSNMTGDLEPDAYYKYGKEQSTQTADAWYNFVFDGATGAQSSFDEATNIIEVTLSLVDGARGDNDLTPNLQIDDPGAPVKLKADTTTSLVDSSGSSLCFIATAAYGSYLHDDVKVLRTFRDDYLLTNTLGREFVAAYYEYSPPVADVISQSETLRTLTRWLLTPLVYAIKHPYLALLLMMGAGLAFAFYRKRAASPT